MRERERERVRVRGRVRGRGVHLGVGIDGINGGEDELLLQGGAPRDVAFVLLEPRGRVLGDDAQPAARTRPPASARSSQHARGALARGSRRRRTPCDTGPRAARARGAQGGKEAGRQGPAGGVEEDAVELVEDGRVDTAVVVGNDGVAHAHALDVAHQRLEPAHPRCAPPLTRPPRLHTQVVARTQAQPPVRPPQPPFRLCPSLALAASSVRLPRRMSGPRPPSLTSFSLRLAFSMYTPQNH